MPPSSAPRASTVVKAAAIFMAVPALLSPMKAAAQQMAANVPTAASADFSKCDAMSRSNPKGAIDCRVDVIKAHTRQMQQETSIARDEASCADQLAAMRAKDPGVVERGRAILAGRPLKQFGVCKLAAELSRG